MTNITLKEVVKGLKAGRVLCIDRKDAPLLPDIMRLVEEGKVTAELVDIDEQGSMMKFKWKKGE